MHLRLFSAFGVFFLLLTSAGQGQGQPSAGEVTPVDVVTTAQAASEGWEFEFSPYAWAPALNGFLGVNERGSNYNLEISDVVDLLDETEMMAFFNLKARKQRVSFFADVIYSKMDNLTTGDLNLRLPAIAQNDLDLEWEELFVQFGAGYTICEFANPHGGTTRFDLQAGGRYVYVSGSDEIVGGPNDRIRIGLDGSENFIEPWIGAMLETDLNRCMTLVLGGDVGGFGVWDASGTSWQYYAMLKYHLTHQLSLDFGYRHLNIKYEDSLGGRSFKFEQEAYGPVVGLTFKF